MSNFLGSLCGWYIIQEKFHLPLSIIVIVEPPHKYGLQLAVPETPADVLTFKQPILITNFHSATVIQNLQCTWIRSHYYELSPRHLFSILCRVEHKCRFHTIHKNSLRSTNVQISCENRFIWALFNGMPYFINDVVINELKERDIYFKMIGDVMWTIL